MKCNKPSDPRHLNKTLTKLVNWQNQTSGVKICYNVFNRVNPMQVHSSESEPEAVVLLLFLRGFWKNMGCAFRNAQFKNKKEQTNLTFGPTEATRANSSGVRDAIAVRYRTRLLNIKWEQEYNIILVPTHEPHTHIHYQQEQPQHQHLQHHHQLIARQGNIPYMKIHVTWNLSHGPSGDCTATHAISYTSPTNHPRTQTYQPRPTTNKKQQQEPQHHQQRNYHHHRDERRNINQW